MGDKFMKRNSGLLPCSPRSLPSRSRPCPLHWHRPSKFPAVRPGLMWRASRRASSAAGLTSEHSCRPRPHLGGAIKAGTFKLQEKDRNDLAVNFVDDTRAAAIEFDFVNKTIKYKPASSKEKSGRDRYYILNATDKEHSEDCAALAQSAAAGPGNGPSGVRAAVQGRPAAPATPLL